MMGITEKEWTGETTKALWWKKMQKSVRLEGRRGN